LLVAVVVVTEVVEEVALEVIGLLLDFQLLVPLL
jgi:hypothetical protein